MYNENFIGVHHDDPKYTEQKDQKCNLVVSYSAGLLGKMDN